MSEEVDAVACIRDQLQVYEDESFTEATQAGLAVVAAMAGLEGDGIVALRFKGDAVTIAGRLTCWTCDDSGMTSFSGSPADGPDPCPDCWAEDNRGALRLVAPDTEGSGT